jgi:hypothetical protein
MFCQNEWIPFCFPCVIFYSHHFLNLKGLSLDVQAHQWSWLFILYATPPYMTHRAGARASTSLVCAGRVACYETLITRTTTVTWTLTWGKGKFLVSLNGQAGISITWMVMLSQPWPKWSSLATHFEGWSWARHGEWWS